MSKVLVGPSEIPEWFSCAFRYTFGRNRIVRVRAYLDPAQALDAVGLRE